MCYNQANISETSLDDSTLRLLETMRGLFKSDVSCNSVNYDSTRYRLIPLGTLLHITTLRAPLASLREARHQLASTSRVPESCPAFTQSSSEMLLFFPTLMLLAL